MTFKQDKTEEKRKKPPRRGKEEVKKKTNKKGISGKADVGGRPEGGVRVGGADSTSKFQARQLERKEGGKKGRKKQFGKKKSIRKKKKGTKERN